MITRRNHYALLVTLVSILVIGAGAWAFATSATRTEAVRPAASASVAHASDHAVSIVECVPGNLVRQPEALTLACADANEYLMELVWEDWGQDQASATGVLVSNDCDPTCVSGHDARAKVAVVAAGLATKDGSSRYTTLSVTVEGSAESRVYELPGFDDPSFS